MSARKSRGGGGARNPKSLANLRRGNNPAPAGNDRAVSHGGYAKHPPGLDAARRELVEWLSAAAPVRDQAGELPAADAATVELAARALARARAFDSWLAVHGYVNEKTGEEKPAAAAAERATLTADRLLSKLGMNPRDRSAMLGDLTRAATSAEEAAANRDARERLDRRLADLDGSAKEVGDGSA